MKKKKNLRNIPRINSLYSPLFFYDLQPRLDHFTQLPSPPCRWIFIYCTFFTESLSFPSPSSSRELQTLCFRHPFPLTPFLTRLPCILPSAYGGSEAARTARHPRKCGLSYSFCLGPRVGKTTKEVHLKLQLPAGNVSDNLPFCLPPHCLPLPPLRGR